MATKWLEFCLIFLLNHLNSNAITVTTHGFYGTTNIGAINNEYFLVSYENTTGAYFAYSSIVGQIYDIYGNKVNKEDVVLAYKQPSPTARIDPPLSQCQCNYNKNNNNIFYGWTNASNFRANAANATYRIIYPSNYNSNMNAINMSQWIIADDENINETKYFPGLSSCACLESDNFVYIWTNRYYLYPDGQMNYIIFVDQNGNNINGKCHYINYISHDEPQYLLPCITPTNSTKTCDTFLGVSAVKGYLFSISQNGQLIRNGFNITQHNIYNQTVSNLAAVSLSNGLYAIFLGEQFSWNYHIIFLSTGYAKQIPVNSQQNWDITVNFDDYGFFHIQMKEIMVSSSGLIRYLCITYVVYMKNTQTVWGSIYQITNQNNTMVNAQIVGAPFKVCDIVFDPYNEVQNLYMNIIGDTLMVGWDFTNGEIEIVLYNISSEVTVF